MIGFGTLGPASVGMSKSEALATGVFVDQTKAAAPVEGCPLPPLAWKKRFKNVDVLTHYKTGAIVSLGVSGPGPQTAKGIAVGSTLDEVKHAYGSSLIGPSPAGYGQSGAWAKQGNAWIGFLFNDPPGKLGNLSQVLFIEVTKGAKPELMRDGC